MPATRSSDADAVNLDKFNPTSTGRRCGRQPAGRRLRDRLRRHAAGGTAEAARDVAGRLATAARPVRVHDRRREGDKLDNNRRACASAGFEGSSASSFPPVRRRAAPHPRHGPAVVPDTTTGRRPPSSSNTSPRCRCSPRRTRRSTTRSITSARGSFQAAHTAEMARLIRQMMTTARASGNARAARAAPCATIVHYNGERNLGCLRNSEVGRFGSKRHPCASVHGFAIPMSPPPSRSDLRTGPSHVEARTCVRGAAPVDTIGNGVKIHLKVQRDVRRSSIARRAAAPGRGRGPWGRTRRFRVGHLSTSGF